jgi:hypothetical protein
MDVRGFFGHVLSRQRAMRPGSDESGREIDR